MQALLRLIQSISRFSGETTAWLVVPLILATTYDVVARYAFNAPTQWAYEVGYMVMGTHALLGMAYTLREHGHIRIDAFTQRFSQGTKAIVDLVGYLIVLPCLAWVTWSLWDYWTARLPHRRIVRAVCLESGDLAVQVDLLHRIRAARPADHRRGHESAHVSGRAALAL